MKATLISSATLIILILAVVLFSIYSSNVLQNAADKIADYDVKDTAFSDITSDFKDMREEFLGDEPLLKLLISEGALLEIDNLFSDIIEYSRAENREGVMASAGRLSVSLEHLISLSGFNPASIF